MGYGLRCMWYIKVMYGKVQLKSYTCFSSQYKYLQVCLLEVSH